MARDGNESVSMGPPAGMIAAGLVVALLVAAYVLVNRNEGGLPGPASQAARTGRGMFRRMGLMTLVALIENDASRKVVVAALRAIARRS